jgi:hypothetical protein
MPLDADKAIDVTIGDGLFPAERTVQFGTVDGSISLFVSSSQVDEKRQTLRVQVLEQDERFALVQVPSQYGGIVVKVERTRVR